MTRCQRWFALLLLAPACVEANEYVAPPPPQVTVARPEQRPVELYHEFTGNVAAWKRVELRARVAGFLEEILYEPGTVVDEGQLLFRIDAKPYEAELAAAQAAVESAEADRELARVRVEKFESLDPGVVSEIDILEARAQGEVAAAAVAGAQARVRQTELDLSYTEIHAPLTGRITMFDVDVGNLVGAGEPTLLATIVAEDYSYAWFDVPERIVVEYRRQPEFQRPDPDEMPDVEVGLALEGDEGFPYAGKLDYAAPEIDRGTGTMFLRAIFENTERKLSPGLFCRLRLPAGRLEAALLVNERAIGVDQAGTFVYVVDDDGTVAYRSVTLGGREGLQRVVTHGLEPTERVIVNGLQRARPGGVVDARESDS